MIREMKLEDFKSVLELISILEDQKYNENIFFSTFCRILDRNDYYCFVYEKENMVIGMITLLVKETLHHNHKTGEIIEVCILPEYRNQKIGEQLLIHIETKAKSLELAELELSSHIKRKDAHRFYERHLYNKDHFNFTKKINH